MPVSPHKYDYSVDDSQVEEFAQNWKNKSARFIRQAVVDSVEEVARTSVGKFMVSSPGPHGNKIGARTTRLMRSIIGAYGAGGEQETIKRISFSGGAEAKTFSALMGSNVPYAAAHEFGTTIPARFVSPVNASVLSWMQGGERRFSMGHMVGPTVIPSRPFLAPALDDSDPRIMKLFKKAVEDIARSSKGD